MHACEFCGKKFEKPVTSGHKRKCTEFLTANPDRNAPACLCGHESTSLTQMKRHRKLCQIWLTRDKKRTASERIIETFKKKYGVEVTNPMHLPGAVERKSKTMKERYGAENSFARESSLFKKVQSYWDGKDRTAHLPKDNFSRPEIKEKIRDYWQKTHGVHNASQVLEIRAKQLATTLSRYGDAQGLRVPEIREKGTATMIERYGVSDAAKSPEIREKIKNTNLERYGVPWTTLGISRLKQYDTQILKYGAKFFASETGKKAVRDGLFLSEHVPADGVRKRKKSLNKPETVVQQLCGSLLYTGNGTYWKYLHKLGHAKNPDFIVPGPNVSHPGRDVTKVVEVLGIYWHGLERVGMERDEYEQILVGAYKNIGIQCLTVWEDETWRDTDALSKKLSMFLESPIESRHIEIKDFLIKDVLVEVDSHPELMPFLNEFHYAGFGRSSVMTCSARLDGMLIAVVKFAPPVRQTISGSVGVDSLLELDRFCIHPSFHKKNFASYLMSKSLSCLLNSSVKVQAVISFADPAQGHVGTIYKASNWEEIGMTSHSYHYILKDGLKMNKKTLFNKARSLKMDERSFANSIGASRVPTPPKRKFLYRFVK